MVFSRMPLMGKNVTVTLNYASGGASSFKVEPEKWNEKRDVIKVSRKPLALGQREIERTDVKMYELTFTGAKVYSDMQNIINDMDELNASGDALDEDQITVTIEIFNPNDGLTETRDYTKCMIHDTSTAADDLEGNIEESFTITAKYRKITNATIKA